MNNSTDHSPNTHTENNADESRREPIGGSRSIDLESQSSQNAHQVTLPEGIVIPPHGSNSKKPLVIAVILLSILLVAASGYIVYQLLAPKTVRETVSISPSVKPQKSQDVATASSVVTSLKEKLTGSPYATDAYIAVAHKSQAGYWTRLSLEEDPNIQYALLKYPTREKDLADLALIGKELEAQGIKKIIDTGDVMEDSADYQAQYASDTIACSLVNFSDGVYDNASNKMNYTSYGITLGCTQVADFTKSVAAIEPMAKALTAGKDKIDPETLYAAPKITKSIVPGYARASVSVSGAVAFVGGYEALLYQTPDSVWHYFLGTQNSLMCTEFSNPDVKKAFAGYECYIGETKTKVAAS